MLKAKSFLLTKINNPPSGSGTEKQENAEPTALKSGDKRKVLRRHIEI